MCLPTVSALMVFILAAGLLERLNQQAAAAFPNDEVVTRRAGSAKVSAAEVLLRSVDQGTLDQ